MIKLAIIGAGQHSRASHGAAVKQFNEECPGRIEPAAVCDLDSAKAEAYARDFGFARTYKDIDTMLRTEKPDAVLAIVPVALTARIGADILRRGIPVMLEKPPGATTAEARELLRVAEETRTPHMISFNRRFNPAIQKAREWLAAHASDRPVRLVVARMLRRKRREPEFGFSTGIHLVDAVLSFLPPPDGVTCRKVRGSVEGCFSFDARFTFPNGAVASLVLAPEVGGLEETYELYGEDYSVAVDAWHGACRAWDVRHPDVHWTPPAGATPAYLDGSVAELTHFVRCLETGAGFSPTLREGLLSFRAAEAVHAGGDTILD